jgi:SAM-dependent methyltransferase
LPVAVEVPDQLEGAVGTVDLIPQALIEEEQVAVSPPRVRLNRDDDPIEPAAQVFTEAGECAACGEKRVHTLFRSTDRLYHTTDKEFSVVECIGCRLIRLHPLPTPSELRFYYPDLYWFKPADTFAAHIEEAYRRFVLMDHIRFVRRALKDADEEGIVLDVGCGGGLFLRMLGEEGHRTVGLDFSLDAAGMAWRQNGVPAVCASLSKAPFPPGSCAGITMFHVLEHLYDPVSYIESAHRLLRPDGRLIIQVPNASSWQFLLFGKNWNGIDVPRHLINFRQRDLDALLDACGFEVLRHKHFSLRDNPAGFATSLAPWLDPMARRIQRVQESPKMRLLKDAAYFGLVSAAIPFAIVEAACRAGSTIMVEARKKP